MSDTLFPYYEAELVFIRKLATEFAKKYPAAAARLQLEPDRSTDPHVERLIESFALLTARVQHKLHDEFPELTDAMLGVLYPHALAPIPSMATVQLHLDPARATPEGVGFARHSELRTAPVGDLRCTYRTASAVTLWPLSVAEATLRPPPFPSGITPPAGAVAALVLRLQANGELGFDALQLRQLRVHLAGDGSLTTPLYELLLNRALGVAYRAPGKPAVMLTPAEALAPAGFAPEDALLDYPANVFAGYQLLTEYFAYPAKYLYFDLLNLDRARDAGATRSLEIVIYFGRTNARLEQLTDADTFRLGCTPVVNLFERTAEPIELTHTRPEYRVTPDVARPHGYEVYSVEQVTAAGTTGGDREYRPFYYYRRGEERTRRAFWHASRRRSVRADDRGSDVYLHLVDASFNPAVAADDTLIVRTLCTNRDLPTQLPHAADEVRFEPAFAAPGVTMRAVRNPTASLRPPPAKGRYWHLISHLNLNHLSMTGDAAGAEAFRGLLALYDLTDADTDPQAAALARQAIQGVESVAARRVTLWVSGPDGGVARGLEVGVMFDEAQYAGTSPYLFASVLERFFGLYVSINTFSQLVARSRQQAGELKRWPPRAGDKAVG